MQYCLQKEGDSSKPTVPYHVHAALRTLCNRKIIMYMLYIAVFLLALLWYYLYLDGLYIVDEVLQGKTLREFSINEKITIRVVAPRSIKDLNTFILEHSICQTVQEIQIIWPHGETRPVDSYFKYPHTHSKVVFKEVYDQDPWDMLYGSITSDTDGILLLDADVSIPCKSLAFVQTVWRSSRDAQVGFFPRFLHWTEEEDGRNLVSTQGWSAVARKGSYSILLPAGLLLCKEYLQDPVSVVATEKVAATSSVFEGLRGYVNTHPQCADLALPLWVAYLASSRGGGSSPGSGVRSFPPTTSPPPIWVDLPELTLRRGVELSACLPNDADAPRKPLAQRKVSLVQQQSDRCLTDIISLLKLTKEDLPYAHFKSTLASTHIVW